MALIDVVKCTMGTSHLVAKFPSDDLRLGTQLVVYSGQTAFFVKGGRIFDEFSAGTYTLTSANLPLLNKLINIPFGRKSPFKAEVWFVNQLAVLDSKWGTATPLQIEDPKYEVIVPVRAYGQYGFKISNPRSFLEQLVGNNMGFNREQLAQYFRGKILSKLTSVIATKLSADNISILNINNYLQPISEYAKDELAKAFDRYGVNLSEFDLISISPREDDPSFIKLKEAKDLAARIKIMGRDVYQMDRSFGVMDRAASNEGTSGGLMNAGIGLGAGVGIGTQAVAMGSQILNTNPAPSGPPPIPQPITYYLSINGQQQGPFNLQAIAGMIQNGSVTPTTLAWKAGMPQWTPINTLPDFAGFFMTPPPLTPNT